MIPKKVSIDVYKRQDGGFAEYAINNVNTLCHVGDNVTDEAVSYTHLDVYKRQTFPWMVLQERSTRVTSLHRKLL